MQIQLYANILQIRILLRNSHFLWKRCGFGNYFHNRSLGLLWGSTSGGNLVKLVMHQIQEQFFLPILNAFLILPNVHFDGKNNMQA